jgi:hypothetical protein
MPELESTMRSKQAGTSPAMGSRAHASTAEYADLGTAAPAAVGVEAQTEEHNVDIHAPGADENRARALMLAAMRRPGAWTRLGDAVDAQVSALPALPLLAGEGGDW